MRNFLRSRTKAFQYAFIGLGIVFRTQPNAWIHTIATLLVILTGAWLRLPGRDWAVLVLAISIVWVSELINTSIETTINLASPGIHPLAKNGKDIGAAAVLVAALASVIVGFLILGPPLWQKIQYWFN